MLKFFIWPNKFEDKKRYIHCNIPPHSGVIKFETNLKYCAHFAKKESNFIIPKLQVTALKIKFSLYPQFFIQNQ